MIHTGGVDIVVALSAIWFVIAMIWVLIQLFKVVRPMLPVRVNCWFCNKYAWVLYKASNSWDCPSCLQYNGFTEDGDYNKYIPEQYSYENRSFAVPKLMTQIPNGLCESCNGLQEKKIKKLAAFQPEDTDDYDHELAALKFAMEVECRLCDSCENLVSRIINQKLARALRMQYNSSPPKYEKTPRDPVSSVWPVFCHMLCFTLAVCLGLSTWFKMDNRDLEILVVYFVNIFYYKQYVTIIPLIVLLLVVIRGSCSVLNIGSVIVWMAIHFLPWLIIETDKSPYLDNWTQDNFELVLLSFAAFINVIAAMRRQKAKLKKVELNKMPAGTHIRRFFVGGPGLADVLKDLNHGREAATSSLSSGIKPVKSNTGTCVEMNESTLFKLLGHRLAPAKQQLGKKQYSSSDKDQLEGSKPYIRASIAKQELGTKQYCSSDKDQLQDSKTYIRASMIRPPKLNFPVYGAQESIPRPRRSSIVSQQVHKSFGVFSMQNTILPQEMNQSLH